MDPPERDLAEFMDKITVPLVRKVFAAVVQHVGPVVTTASPPHFKCSAQQNACVSEMEEIASLHKRRMEMPESFRAALPKSMY